MLGVFDSGAGGLICALRLRKLLPTADILFYQDRENAPYGTKTEQELERLIEKDIERLKSAGATSLLGACGTAGCVMIHKKDNPKFSGVKNVITPTVKRAVKISKNGNIGVIATSYSIRSGTYRALIEKENPTAFVREVSAQALVPLAEMPKKDRPKTALADALSDIQRQFDGFPMDTLVLGCTHFSWLSCEIERAFPGVCLVPSDKIGAEAFAETLSEREKTGQGRFIKL